MAIVRVTNAGLKGSIHEKVEVTDAPPVARAKIGVIQQIDAVIAVNKPAPNNPDFSAVFPWFFINANLIEIKDAPIIFAALN